jgi:phospholipid N-methyltransferase
LKSTILGQFIRNPRSIGALCPSSAQLSKTITSEIEIEKAKSVVELGPGTGAITNSILKSIAPETNFFAVELNHNILAAFQKRFPKTKVYHESASNLHLLLEQEGLEYVDVIVSGLPWAAFPDNLQNEIMQSVINSLRPGGVFTTFAYLQGTLLPTGQKFKKKLDRYFTTVSKSPVVWCNFPPAFCYRCIK